MYYRKKISDNTLEKRKKPFPQNPDYILLTEEEYLEELSKILDTEE